MLQRKLMLAGALSLSLLLAGCPLVAKKDVTNAPSATSQSSSSETVSNSDQAAQTATRVGFFLASDNQSKDSVELNIGNKSIWVQPDSVFARNDLLEVQPRKVDGEDISFVRFVFKPDAATNLAKFTADNIGKYIVMVVGQEIIGIQAIGGSYDQGYIDVRTANDEESVAITEAILGRKI